MKKKTIFFDYFRIGTKRFNKEENTVVKQVADLETFFEKLSKQSTIERTYNKENDKIRIQELVKKDNIWEIQILKLRDEITPGIADQDGNYSLEILEDGKYYCESTTMIYDTSNSVFVMQKNRFGLQAGNIEVLFNRINKNNEIEIILEPIIEKNKLKMLDENSVFRGLEVAIINDNITYEKSPYGVFDVLSNLRKYNGNLITISIGYNKRCKKDEYLNPSLVMDTINEFYGNSKTYKLKASVKFDDDTKVEKVDLLDDRVCDKDMLQYSRENPITHVRIVQLLNSVYERRIKSLNL